MPAEGRVSTESRWPASRAIVSGGLCGALLTTATWHLHPTSLDRWNLTHVAGGAILLFAPVLLIVWAVAVPGRWSGGGLRWVQSAILIHAMIAAFLTLTTCSGALGASALGPAEFGAAWFASMLVSVCLLALAPGGGGGSEFVTTYRRYMLLLGAGAGAGAVAALWAWSLASAALVVAGAEHIAASRPYCIQVAGAAYEYRPARSLYDLTGLKMRAPFMGGGSTDYQFVFHGMLLTPEGRPPRWNWSHRSMRFRPITPYTDAMLTGTRQVSCQPRPGYARLLPLFSHRPPA